MQLGHLLFRVKIAHTSQPSYDHVKLIFVYKISQQPVTHVHCNIFKMGGGFLNHFHAFLKGEHGFLFKVHHYTDYHLIEEVGRSFYNV